MDSLLRTSYRSDKLKTKYELSFERRHKHFLKQLPSLLEKAVNLNHQVDFAIDDIYENREFLHEPKWSLESKNQEFLDLRVYGSIEKLNSDNLVLFFEDMVQNVAFDFQKINGYEFRIFANSSGLKIQNNKLFDLNVIGDNNLRSQYSFFHNI